MIYFFGHNKVQPHDELNCLIQYFNILTFGEFELKRPVKQNWLKTIRLKFY